MHHKKTKPEILVKPCSHIAVSSAVYRFLLACSLSGPCVAWSLWLPNSTGWKWGSQDIRGTRQKIVNMSSLSPVLMMFVMHLSLCLSLCPGPFCRLHAWKIHGPDIQYAATGVTECEYLWGLRVLSVTENIHIQ